MTEIRRSEHSHETPGISVNRPCFPDGVELSISQFELYLRLRVMSGREDVLGIGDR
jgi:hypothetical protein